MIFINSCRTQEEDSKVETLNDNQENMVFRRGSDTLQTDSTRASRPLPIDPPPKNGHQW